MKHNWKHIIWETFTWIILLSVLIISLGFTENQRGNELCSKVEIQILDSTVNQFLKSEDILQILNDKNYKIIGQPLNKIPLNNIESDLFKNAFVKNVQIYTTIDGTFKIDIIQKKPILRIINYNYESYYLDEEGNLFPISNNYTSRVLIISGNINEPYALFSDKKAYEAENQDILKRETLLDDIFYLSSHIYNDSLWNSLFESIFVNEKNEFELIPKWGDFIIELGDTSNLQNKFTKLIAFYKNIVPKLKGGEFLKISLKYNNQIVCTKNNKIYE